jgi:SAM-dependent methyltransferase
MDWGQGRYERVAEQLLPAAEELIEAAAPRPGQQVVDLGTGTGNGALLAAARGAHVIGVDPAERLLSVAAERARERDLDLDLRLGSAEANPIDDDAAELITSVFGVVFSPDAEIAAAEMARIAAPGCRLYLTAWIPEGAIAEAGRVGREAVAAATAAQPGPPPFAWHDREALEGLLGPHGFGEVAVERRGIPFRGASAHDWFEGEVRFHPIRVAAVGVLSEEQLAEVSERTLAILSAANEDPGAFQVTSHYALVSATFAG